MKKTIVMFWLWLCVGGLFAACNYDEACWAPGESSGAGVGGGVITPGAGGGYGEEPEPEPQTEERWTCTGPVTDCTCTGLPGITLSCPMITTIQTSEMLGKDEGKIVCALDLVVKLAASQSPSMPVPKCVCAVSAQTCVKSQDKEWSCAGRTSCKRGKSACKTPDEVWDGWCGYGPGEGEEAQTITHHTAEEARGVLLEACEEQLAEDGGGDWFCMPGTVKCVPQAQAKAWACSGPIKGCTGSDKYGMVTGMCALAYGVGPDEASAKQDALEDCQATLGDQLPTVKYWECTDASTLSCAQTN